MAKPLPRPAGAVASVGGTPTGGPPPPACSSLDFVTQLLIYQRWLAAAEAKAGSHLACRCATCHRRRGQEGACRVQDLRTGERTKLSNKYSCTICRLYEIQAPCSCCLSSPAPRLPMRSTKCICQLSSMLPCTPSPPQRSGFRLVSGSGVSAMAGCAQSLAPHRSRPSSAAAGRPLGPQRSPPAKRGALSNDAGRLMALSNHPAAGGAPGAACVAGAPQRCSGSACVEAHDLQPHQTRSAAGPRTCAALGAAGVRQHAWTRDRLPRALPRPVPPSVCPRISPAGRLITLLLPPPAPHATAVSSAARCGLAASKG